MGVIWNAVLFLLRRGPEIYEAGRRLGQGRQGVPALPEGDSGAGVPRLDAVEREIGRLSAERERLAADVDRLAREVDALRESVDRARDAARLPLYLLLATLLASLCAGAVLLARLP